MAESLTYPCTFAEWVLFYGDPRDPDSDKPLRSWVEENLKFFRTPFPLYLSWNLAKVVNNIYIHKKIGDKVIAGLDRMATLRGSEYISKKGHNKWGGAWNYRMQRGSEVALSSHAFAGAFDLNPDLAPLGEVSRQPEYIVEIFTDLGFTWGGEFPRVDGMHFQWGSGI